MSIDFLTQLSDRQRLQAAQLALDSLTGQGNVIVDVKLNGEVWATESYGPNKLYSSDPRLLGKYSGATGKYESYNN